MICGPQTNFELLQQCTLSWFLKRTAVFDTGADHTVLRKCVLILVVFIKLIGRLKFYTVWI